MRPMVLLLPALILIGGAIGGATARGGRIISFLDRFAAEVFQLFAWIYAGVTLLAVFAILMAFISPLGGIRIGGREANKVLKPGAHLAVSLCAALAVGVLFWSAAEPVVHMHAPPPSFKIVPQGGQARQFALAVTYLHWGLTPFAVFATASIVFALSFFNLSAPFSLGAVFSASGGAPRTNGLAAVVDMLALLAMASALCAALTMGIIAVAEGLGRFIPVVVNTVWLGLLAGLIAMIYTTSSLLGLPNGIRRLSLLNFNLFVLLLLFAFLAGSPGSIIGQGLAAVKEYFWTFAARSLFTGAASGDRWPTLWTLDRWATWCAFGPFLGLFLGRISVGYTVRQMIMALVIFPTLFVIAWISVFGVLAQRQDMRSGGAVFEAIRRDGAPEAIYHALEALPLGGLSIGFLLLIAITSYATAADSTLQSIGLLTVHGKSDNPAVKRQRTVVTVFWGGLIAALAWIAAVYGTLGAVQAVGAVASAAAAVITAALAILLAQFALGPGRLRR